MYERVERFILKQFSFVNVVILFLLLGVVFDLILNVYFDVSILQFVLTDSNGATDWAIRGQWGDSLSGHFSALAFMAVAYSIFLQRKDIKQEREYETFKLTLEMIKELDEKQVYIKEINFPYKLRGGPGIIIMGNEYVFKTISEFANRLKDGSSLKFDIDKNRLNIEIISRLNLFYSTVEAIKIMLDKDVNKKYIDVLNSKLDQYKSVVSDLIRIFVYFHHNKARNMVLLKKTTDHTYKTLLEALSKIDFDKEMDDRFIDLLREVKNDHLRIKV